MSTVEKVWLDNEKSKEDKFAKRKVSLGGVFIGHVQRLTNGKAKSFALDGHEGKHLNLGLAIKRLVKG